MSNPSLFIHQMPHNCEPGWCRDHWPWKSVSFQIRGHEHVVIVPPCCVPWHEGFNTVQETAGYLEDVIGERIIPKDEADEIAEFFSFDCRAAEARERLRRTVPRVCKRRPYYLQEDVLGAFERVSACEVCGQAIDRQLYFQKRWMRPGFVMGVMLCDRGDSAFCNRRPSCEAEGVRIGLERQGNVKRAMLGVRRKAVSAGARKHAAALANQTALNKLSSDLDTILNLTEASQ